MGETEVFLLVKLCADRHRTYEKVHKYNVAEASTHDEQVENFMRAEVRMFGIELWHFYRVNNTAKGVDDTACKEPVESGRTQVI